MPASARYACQKIKNLASYFPCIESLTPEEFDAGMHQRLREIEAISQGAPAYRPDLLRRSFEAVGGSLDSSLLMRQARHKPFGYPGDFQIIDWIYTQTTPSQGRGIHYDHLILRQHASQAVRNRKECFLKTCHAFLKGRKDASLLSLASGPCREVAEFIAQKPASLRLRVRCVDQDPKALAAAQDLFHGAGRNSFEASWTPLNAFQYRPRETFDLIWAAGLFDYLGDQLAVTLLRRMWKWLAPGGRLMVGNMHPLNPSRNAMEWCLAWFLRHRTEEEMLELAEKAGIPSTCAHIESEPLHVNIFLVAERG